VLKILVIDHSSWYLSSDVCSYAKSSPRAHIAVPASADVPH